MSTFPTTKDYQRARWLSTQQIEWPSKAPHKISTIPLAQKGLLTSLPEYTLSLPLSYPLHNSGNFLYPYSAIIPYPWRRAVLSQSSQLNCEVLQSVRAKVSLSVCSTGHVGHLNLEPLRPRRLTLDLSTACPHFKSIGGFPGVLQAMI